MTEWTKGDKAPSLLKSLNDVIIEEGGEATVECQVNGHPEPKVTFYKNGAPISPSSKITVGEFRSYIVILFNIFLNIFFCNLKKSF